MLLGVEVVVVLELTYGDEVGLRDSKWGFFLLLLILLLMLLVEAGF